MIWGTPGLRLGGSVFSSAAGNRSLGGVLKSVGKGFATPWVGTPIYRANKRKKMPKEMQIQKTQEGPNYQISQDSANSIGGTVTTSEGSFGLAEGYSPFRDKIAKAKKRRGENESPTILG